MGLGYRLRWPRGLLARQIARQMVKGRLRGQGGPVAELVAEPSELALGIVPGVLPSLVGGRGERHLARQMADQPGDAMRLHGRQQRIEPPRRQFADLIERPARQHSGETGVDAAVERGAIGRDEDPRRARGIDQGRQALGLPVGQRAAGRLDDLEGARDARAIVGVEPGGGSRIAAVELAMQRGRPLAGEPLAHAGADVDRDRRHGRESRCQRLEIEPGAADEDRHLADAGDLGERLAGVRHILADRIIHRGVHMAVEQMRHARLLGRAGARRDDREVAIDLHRIRVDDRAADPLGEPQRQRRLAARGRPGDEDRLRRTGAFFRVAHVNVLATGPHIWSHFWRRSGIHPAPEPRASCAMRRDTLTLIEPFRALRPAPGRAADILAPPYDVLSSAEARERAKGKPWSFLHISKPEIDLDAGIDPYDRAVYAKAADNLARMIAAGIMIRDAKPCYYVYRLTWGDRRQTGLAAVAAVADY